MVSGAEEVRDPEGLGHQPHSWSSSSLLEQLWPGRLASASAEEVYSSFYSTTLFPKIVH